MKIEFTGINSSPKEGILTLLVDKNFEEYLNTLKRANDFACNSDNKTVSNFTYELDGKPYTRDFNKPLDLNFTNVMGKNSSYTIMLQLEGTDRVEEVCTMNRSLGFFGYGTNL